MNHLGFHRAFWRPVQSAIAIGVAVGWALAVHSAFAAASPTPPPPPSPPAVPTPKISSPTSSTPTVPTSPAFPSALVVPSKQETATPAIRPTPVQGRLTTTNYPARTRYIGSPAKKTNQVGRPFPLVFPSDLKEVEVSEGVTNVVVEFALTNSSPEQVTVEYIRGSCGCTVAKMPSNPWVLPPGVDGVFEVKVDLRGKSGTLNKMIYLFTSHGYKTLRLKVVIPMATGGVTGKRLTNLRLAAADRQAVFKGDCASCHAAPGEGKTGEALFHAVCGVCHEAEHRASMVPELAQQTRIRSPELWRFWITYGKANTLMPAFSQRQGGILTEEQIASLVEYCYEEFPPASPTNSLRISARSPSP